MSYRIALFVKFSSENMISIDTWTPFPLSAAAQTLDNQKGGCKREGVRKDEEEEKSENGSVTKADTRK